MTASLILDSPDARVERREGVPTDYVAIMEELNAMQPTLRANVIEAMRNFYYRFSSMEKSGDNRMLGHTRVNAMTDTYLLKSLQQLIFAAPLYGVYINPDFGRILPERIALAEFDRQAVNEPLKLSETL